MNSTRLKILALIALSLALCGLVRAQTNVPLSIPVNLDFLTNIPTTTNYQTAVAAVEVGALLKNGQVENMLKVDGYYKTNWIVSLEIQNAPVATVIDSFTLYGGYRKAWVNAEVYAELGCRRTFTTTSYGGVPSWQGVALLGASWVPMTGGKWSLFAEGAATTAPTGDIFSTAPGAEMRGGVKLHF